MRRRRASTERRVWRGGPAIIYRRPHTLKAGAVRGSGSKAPSKLRAQMAHPVGAPDLLLHRAELVGGEYREATLAGEAWKGLEITVGDVTYSLRADAVVSNNHLAISIEPGLEAPLALEEEVQIAPAIEYRRSLAGGRPLQARMGRHEVADTASGATTVATLSILRHGFPAGPRPRVGHRIEVPSRSLSGRVAEVLEEWGWGWKIALEIA